MSAVGKSANSPSIDTYWFETVSVDNNGEIIVRQSGSTPVRTESLNPEIAIELVLVPGGSFMMGDDRHHPDEQPIHQVTIAPFCMGKYPITVAQYRSIMGDNLGMGIGADYPIEQISWDDTLEFCTKLSQQTGTEYNLPTEAQWEYACRATTTTPFHFGATITPDLANYNGEYPYNGAATGENRERATPVGTFPPNAFGLHDLHGNVWEWCQDTYQPNYHNAPTDGSAIIDPTDNAKRVMRGGAWDYVAKACRSSVRCSLNPKLRINGCGFRIVLPNIPSWAKY